jgi:hypothetical protein
LRATENRSGIANKGIAILRNNGLEPMQTRLNPKLGAGRILFRQAPDVVAGTDANLPVGGRRRDHYGNDRNEPSNPQARAGHYQPVPQGIGFSTSTPDFETAKGFVNHHCGQLFLVNRN